LGYFLGASLGALIAALLITAVFFYPASVFVIPFMTLWFIVPLIIATITLAIGIYSMSDFERSCLITGILDGVAFVSSLALFATGVTSSIIRLLSWVGVINLGISLNYELPAREQCLFPG
jgi:hypothetical protein